MHDERPKRQRCALGGDGVRRVGQRPDERAETVDAEEAPGGGTRHGAALRPAPERRFQPVGREAHPLIDRADRPPPGRRRRPAGQPRPRTLRRRPGAHALRLRTHTAADSPLPSATVA
uniref:Uncharacterized protein n=1 Tax=Angiostrongylus cantonensis TaxID=6313 RepID=A0A0K0DN27_ANGCA